MSDDESPKKWIPPALGDEKPSDRDPDVEIPLSEFLPDLSNSQGVDYVSGEPASVDDLADEIPILKLPSALPMDDSSSITYGSIVEITEVYIIQNGRVVGELYVISEVLLTDLSQGLDPRIYPHEHGHLPMSHGHPHTEPIMDPYKAVREALGDETEVADPTLEDDEPVDSVEFSLDGQLASAWDRLMQPPGELDLDAQGPSAGDTIDLTPYLREKKNPGPGE